METKLYISSELIDLKGKEFFRDYANEYSISQLALVADSEGVCVDEEEGIYVSRDDMYDLYLTNSPDADGTFVDIEDLFE